MQRLSGGNVQGQAKPSDQQSTLPTTGRSQRVGPLIALPQLIRELGSDPIALMQSAGFGRDAFRDADGRVPYDALVRLLDEAAEQTGCAHFGLLAGRMGRLATLGVVGELARHSATVGEALQSLTANQYLNSGGGIGYLLSQDAMTEVGYAIHYPAVAHTWQAYDCVLAVIFNVLRELCGPDWQPFEVLLPHARPPDTSPYRNLFKSLPHFNAEVCAVRFSSRWMERRIEGANPVRRQRASRVIEEAADIDFLEQAIRVLRVELIQGRGIGDDVARALAMGRRTFNRRLEARGTTFQRLRDEVRLEAARQMLGESTISLDDVAAALGYSGISSFMRTFRRWTGTSPARWRRNASHSQPRIGSPSTTPGYHVARATGLPDYSL